MLVHLLARALDGVLLRVQEMLHEQNQLDLAPLVDAISRAVLRGAQEPELAFPVAKHMRLEIGEVADLANTEELLHGFGCTHASCSDLSSRDINSVTASRA